MRSRYSEIRDATKPIMGLLSEEDHLALSLRLKTTMFFEIRGLEDRVSYEIREILRFLAQKGIEIS